MYLGGDAAQAVRTVIHGIHTGHDGEQRLCGADIGSGFFAAYMLFACLQRHAQGGVAVGVHRHTDDAAWHRALVRITASKVGGVRAAVTHRHTEALRRTQHYVCTPFTGRCQQHQTEDVGCDCDAHTLRLGLRDKCGVIMYHTVRRRILQQRAIHLLVQRDSLEVAYHELYA